MMFLIVFSSYIRGCVSSSPGDFDGRRFLDPEGSLSAMTVVLVLVLDVVDVTGFQKMPKALLIRNAKLRNLAYTFKTSFPTDLPS